MEGTIDGCNRLDNDAVLSEDMSALRGGNTEASMNYSGNLNRGIENE